MSPFSLPRCSFVSFRSSRGHRQRLMAICTAAAGSADNSPYEWTILFVTYGLLNTGSPEDSNIGSIPDLVEDCLGG